MEIPEFYRREGRGRKVGNQPERGEEARGVTFRSWKHLIK